MLYKLKDRENLKFYSIKNLNNNKPKFYLLEENNKNLIYTKKIICSALINLSNEN